MQQSRSARSRQGRRAGAAVAAALLHGLAVWWLVAAVRAPPPLTEPPVVEVTLMAPVTLAEHPQAVAPPPPVATPERGPIAASRKPAAQSPPPRPPPKPAPPVLTREQQQAALAAAVRNPGVAAIKPGAAPDAAGGTRTALRTSVGCDDPGAVGLTAAESERCARWLKRLRRNPKTYAVISAEQKRFFDGECDPDDDWCLYRTGKGPYPGLLAIGKKKHKHDD